jgi:hypothetical protein
MLWNSLGTAIADAKRKTLDDQRKQFKYEFENAFEKFNDESKHIIGG